MTDEKLTPEEVEQIAASWSDLPAKMFCINGVIVEIPIREALKRLPYDVMTTLSQPTMRTVLDAQGKTDVFFLTPMTSEMILTEVEGCRELENINKTTANLVGGMMAPGSKEIYGPDEDGVLR